MGAGPAPEKERHHDLRRWPGIQLGPRRFRAHHDTLLDPKRGQLGSLSANRAHAEHGYPPVSRRPIYWRPGTTESVDSPTGAACGPPRLSRRVSGFSTPIGFSCSLTARRQQAPAKRRSCPVLLNGPVAVSRRLRGHDTQRGGLPGALLGVAGGLTWGAPGALLGAVFRGLLGKARSGGARPRRAGGSIGRSRVAPPAEGRAASGWRERGCGNGAAAGGGLVAVRCGGMAGRSLRESRPP
jgi:hypothetical protein